MKQAVIVNAKRTPIGKVGGMWKAKTVEQLLAPILLNLTDEIGVEVDEVIIGNVVGPGGNVARFTLLEAGLPLNVPGMTIDRQCSAGLEAIRTASLFIRAGVGQCYVAGGVESASTSPYEKRAQFSPVHIGDPDMGVAAEYVAKRYHLSKQDQDDYALLSYERSWSALNQGFYNQEVLAIDNVVEDEVFSRKRNLKTILQRARPLFDRTEGTVTAANSCAINDGASAVVIMEETVARAQGYSTMLRFVDSVVTGVHPCYPGSSPIPAVQKLLSQNNLTVADIDLFEINEAFSSKILACQQALAIPIEKLNVLGGALTIGHPYGASGAILVTRLLYEAERRSARYAIATIGSAGGIGLAVLFEFVQT